MTAAGAGPVDLRTQRLHLRGHETADIPALARIGGDPRVAPMLFVPTVPWPQEAVAEFIETSRYRGVPGFRLGIALAGGPLIGSIGLSDAGEVFYFLDPDHHRQGYAPEALTAFIGFCFAKFDLPAVLACVFTDNPPSAVVLTRLGFAQTGEGAARSGGRLEPAPLWRYRLSRADWDARSAPGTQADG